MFKVTKYFFSGMTRQDRYAVRRVPELVGTSGHMLIHFYSDVAYNMTGFNITFSIDSCPSERHDLTCSGRGSCVLGIKQFTNLKIQKKNCFISMKIRLKLCGGMNPEG